MRQQIDGGSRQHKEVMPNVKDNLRRLRENLEKYQNASTGEIDGFLVRNGGDIDIGGGAVGKVMQRTSHILAIEFFLPEGFIFPDHWHPAGETLMLLEGCIYWPDDKNLMDNPGNWHYSPPGEIQMAEIKSDCRVLCIWSPPLNITLEIT